MPADSSLPSSHPADEEVVELPSKSSRKREMHALQALGERLVALPPDQLGRVDLPDVLRDAVRAAQGFRMEARRRQLQYIGKLMRKVDPAPIRAMLDTLSGTSASEVARMHRLERLRSEVLEDDGALGRIAEAWPHADLQVLRTLRRNALKERAAGRAPKAFRELFRVLRELDDAQPDLDHGGQAPAAAERADGAVGAVDESARGD